MGKIKNKHYKKFLTEGIIDIIEETDINKALENITGKNRIMGRSLLIALYLTGARPAEILELKPKHIKKEARYITIQLKTLKKGLARKIYLKKDNKLAKELYQYSQTLFPELTMFHAYKNHYAQTYQTKKGKKTIITTTSLLRYHLQRWFKNVTEEPITPYYLRHNRFSKLSQKGATYEQIRQLKGAKTLNSVTPYLHMSRKTATATAKLID